MNKSHLMMFVFGTLFVIGANAAEGDVCPACTKNSLMPTPAVAAMAKAMDASGCEKASERVESMKKFDEVVKAEEKKGEKIVLARKDPDARSSNSMTYKFPSQKLKPGESIYLWVPSDLKAEGVNFVILGHRQNPETQTGTTPGEKWDKVPGLTSVQVYDSSRKVSGRWRYWNGMASGKDGAKFAEPGERFEMEGLYQWSKNGHVGVADHQEAHDELHGEVVRLKSVGQDDVEISELTLKTNTAPAKEYVSKVFETGTEFGDQRSGHGYEMGGGQNNNGMYPNSLQLKPYGSSASQKLPEGWKIENGALVVPLPKGKILTGVEIAGGDSHQDGVKNSDGGWGTQGWSKLTVMKRRANGTTDMMMDHENVPPEGFLSAAPKTCGEIVEDGDSLVIKASSDVMFLAGLRIGLK